MQHKQINLRSKRIKTILITTLLCVVGFSSCHDDGPTPLPDNTKQYILGKWILNCDDCSLPEQYYIIFYSDNSYMSNFTVFETGYYNFSSQRVIDFYSDKPNENFVSRFVIVNFAGYSEDKNKLLFLHYKEGEYFFYDVYFKQNIIGFRRA